MVAINAINYQGKFKQEEQYHSKMMLREMNKAFAGFVCKDERGDLILDLIALNQGEYNQEDEEEDDIDPEDCSSLATADDIFDNEETVEEVTQSTEATTDTPGE